jgi:ketopantoate reductase
MKLEWENGRLIVRPTEEEIAECKRRAFLESGHETIEELLSVLRARGVEVPATAYEKAVERMEKAVNRRARGGDRTT